jgi:hypothetical protein
MDLSKYKLSPNNEEPTEIKYFGNPSRFYEIKNIHQYKQFWKTYSRPPHKNDFKEIHEHINILYTDAYRRTSGAEYTPPCFVKKQNELLNKYYGENWQEEYIVYDPCCGVGNLEDDFPEEYIKNYCFLSTLEQMDVDRCKSKGFENVRTFDYLKDNKEPTFKYKGQEIDKDKIKVDRYEFNKKLDTFDFKKTYTYNNKPNLIKEIEKEIKKNSVGGGGLESMFICKMLSTSAMGKVMVEL